MEVGLSALSRGAEWGKNKFWLDTTHFGWATLIVAVSCEKKCDCFTGGNRTWSCIFRAILRCFTTKLETQRRARRQKMILYKVRLKESCDLWYESVLRKPKVSYNEFRISVAPLSSLEYSYCICGDKRWATPNSSTGSRNHNQSSKSMTQSFCVPRYYLVRSARLLAAAPVYNSNPEVNKLAEVN